MKTVAVIPAYNEAKRIGSTIQGVRAYVPHILVVDDGSRDETASVARDAGAMVVRHWINRGQGAALKTGTEGARRLGADIILHIDADGQHDPSSIPVLLEPLETGMADVVFGSRFMGEEAVGMPVARRLLLLGARTFNALAVGVPRRVTDPQSGYRALTSRASERVDFHQDRMASCSEILRLVTRSSLRWREVPVRVRYSSDSLKKGQKPWDAFRIAWELLVGTFMR